MSSSPLISIYVPSKNYGKYLEQAIESVINQTYTNWELFIVDDKSSDSTHVIGAEYVSKYPQKITFIQNQVSMGLQRIANLILRRCKGKYVMRLDGDDWLDESALAVLLNKIESSDDIALAYGNFFYVDSNGQIIGYEQKVNEKTHLVPCHGACTLIRTRFLKNAGGYDEQIDAQDGLDMWQKLTTRHRVVHSNSYIFFYRQHKSSLSQNKERLLLARRKIYENQLLDGKNSFKPRCLVVIGAKSVYDTVKNVPSLSFRNVSILEHAIKSADECEFVSDIMISADQRDVVEFSQSVFDDRYKKELHAYVREVPQDVGRLPVNEILTEAIYKCEQLRGYRPDITLFLSMFAINRRGKHITNAINALRSTNSDTVVTVNELNVPVFSIKHDGLKLVNLGKLRGLSYEAEQLYAFNGVTIGAWSEVIVQGSLFNGKICYSEMSDLDSRQINIEDLQNVEHK